MQEKQVTIEGATHPLTNPFMVVLPDTIWFWGTYPLTEVQADRFMFELGDYLGKDDEKKAIFNADYGEEPDIKASSLKEIVELQAVVRRYMSRKVGDYIVSLVMHYVRTLMLEVKDTRASVALFKGSEHAFLKAETSSSQ